MLSKGLHHPCVIKPIALGVGMELADAQRAGLGATLNLAKRSIAPRWVHRAEGQHAPWVPFRRFERVVIRLAGNIKLGPPNPSDYRRVKLRLVQRGDKVFRCCEL